MSTDDPQRSALDESDFIRKVYGDPATPPDGVALVGRLGRSDRDSCWRIYDSPDLTSFFEVAESDVLFVEPSAGGDAGLSTVWIKSSASIEQKIHASQQIQAGLLEGALSAQAALLGDNAGPVAKPQCVTPTFGISIRVTIALCPATPSILHRITQTCP